MTSDRAPTRCAGCGQRRYARSVRTHGWCRACTDTEPPDPSWYDRAACAHAPDPSWWDPGALPADTARALDVCERCPVVEACGQAARAYAVDGGVWAGRMLGAGQGKGYRTDLDRRRAG